MLGKLLLTLAVIATALLYVKHRNQAEQKIAADQNGNLQTTSATSSLAGRRLAWLVLAVLIGTAVSVYLYRWQDNHKILTVNLYRENQSGPVSYRVYKYQLQSRQFVTTDGRQITVASSERMEIIGLD
ncbi:MAG: hypothetical protein OXE78_11330 [Gammaproteobacteria bacterium]|nr:hypothetical protein [Gammaproteobacteria bacterium]MCY4357981.1 hypothetical protein [Gammaproteobacteria bacterium]